MPPPRGADEMVRCRRFKSMINVPSLIRYLISLAPATRSFMSALEQSFERGKEARIISAEPHRDSDHALRAALPS